MVKDRSCRVAGQEEIRMQGLLQRSNWVPWIHKKRVIEIERERKRERGN
jgi:hypothetical protein